MHKDKLPAIVSIHDVMPHTLDDVDYCLAQLKNHGLQMAYLLVVPGLHWSSADHSRLKRYIEAGHILVAHGWRHRAERISSIRHRIHSKLVSRDVAEHLCLDSDGIVQLMQMSHAWFAQHGYPAPQLYVPPAWALGQVSMAALRQTGFLYVESTRGFVDIQNGKRIWLPLLGYETDTMVRALAVSQWNPINWSMSQFKNRQRSGYPIIRQLADQPTRQPIRLSIHPKDFELRLADDLHRALDKISVTDLSAVTGFSAPNGCYQQRTQVDQTQTQPQCE